MAPNSARQIVTVATFELLKYLRGRRLLAIVLLTVFISAIFLVVPPAIGSAYPKDPKDFTTGMLAFLGILSILSATFFGADAIVSEFESKTGYFLFPNPIGKTAIFLGKFVASAVVSVGAIELYYAIVLVSVRAIDGSIPANTGLSFAYSLFYLFAILAVAYLYSAVMRSSVYSLVLTFFTFLLILPIIDAVGAIAKFKPWFSLTFASGISQYVFRDPYPTDNVLTKTALTGPSSGAQIPVTQYFPAIPLSLIVMAAYFFFAFALAIILARRREM
jgi:ABC-type transport system involved in multi-copper enzyme maturation permease subunit